MKKIPEIIKYIQLDCIGENTNQHYFGGFRVKVLLTHAERLQVERIYTSLLPKDDNASNESKMKAAAISELEVRIVEAPMWWQNSRSGRDLLDSQPLWELLIEINKKTEEWKSELNKEVKNEDVLSNQ